MNVPAKFVFPKTLSGYNRTVQALNNELNEVNTKIHKPLAAIGTENLVSVMGEVAQHLVNIKSIGELLGDIVDTLEKKRGVDPNEKKTIQSILGKIILMQSNRSIASFSRSIKDINGAMQQLSQFSETLSTDMGAVKKTIAKNKSRQAAASE